MILRRHQNFRKNYQKRIFPHKNLDKKFEERLKLFLLDSKNSKLKDHRLIGSLAGFRSFSVTGDIRVVYRKVGDDIELYDIGSHNQVY